MTHNNNITLNLGVVDKRNIQTFEYVALLNNNILFVVTRMCQYEKRKVDCITYKQNCGLRVV